MNPTTGGRVILTLSPANEASVSGRAELFTPEGTWSSLVDVRIADGEVTFQGFSPAGEPPWLVALARSFLRGAWRDTRDGSAWPLRITRWRAEPSR